jgi:H+/Cl- antiporter ClcA
MEIGKQIIVIGLILVVVGIIWMLFQKNLQWFGNLPGDIKWEKGNSKIYIPIVSMLLISLLINLCWWIYKWLTR